MAVMVILRAGKERELLQCGRRLNPTPRQNSKLTLAEDVAQGLPALSFLVHVNLAVNEIRLFTECWFNTIDCGGLAITEAEVDDSWVNGLFAR